MKYNKLAILFSSIFSCISLASYTCFKYICCVYNPWVADVSLAVFGSSALIIATSIIGYLIEKSHQREEILHCNCDLSFAFEILSSMSDQNKLSRGDISRIVDTALNKASALRSALVTYYDGCIIKDSSLKIIINEDLFSYARDLSKLISYTSHPEARGDIIDFYFKQLLNQSISIADKIFSWMKSKKFKIGEDFDFGDDFIKNYENECDNKNNL